MRRVRGWMLAPWVGVFLIGCEADKPLPEGAGITVAPSRSSGPRFPRHELVIPEVVSSGLVGRMDGRDAMFNGTLLEVRLGEITGPVTAGAWLCLNDSGPVQGLELTESALLALEPALEAWNLSGRSSPSSGCDLRAANEQLASLRAGSPDHAAALAKSGRKLNYSRVSVQTRSPRCVSQHTMTAASYFCAVRLGLAGGVTLALESNPRLNELTSAWKEGEAGKPWVCDAVRVKEELAIIRRSVAPGGAL